MALPPVSDVVKVNQIWELDNNDAAESIWHFQYTGGPPSSATCVGLAAAFNAAVASNLKTLLHTINAIGVTTVLDLNSSSGAQGTGGSVTSGTLTGTQLPASTCVVMNHHIARRYRGGKPRTYAPFGSSSGTATTGSWGTGFLNSCNADWVAFITSCLAISVSGTAISQFVNVSYFSNKVQRVTPLVDPITSSIARTRMGTQRRRLATA
jgi:hypothetical protein